MNKSQDKYPLDCNEYPLDSNFWKDFTPHATATLARIRQFISQGYKKELLQELGYLKTMAEARANVLKEIIKKETQ